jgi:hypothetical protein
MQWIPSHTGIAGNDVADAAAKVGANLPSVTNDIGITVSEATSKLICAATKLWNEQYSVLAATKDWVEPITGSEGTFPNIPLHFLPYFYRLRAKTYKLRFTQQQCICGASLSFQHFMSCASIHETLTRVKQVSRENSPPMTRTNLLCKNPLVGWKMVTTFLADIHMSEIGHLI